MKLLRRQPEPEPEEDDDVGAMPFGVHPILDLMAIQNLLIKQQRHIWRALERQYKHELLIARLWMLVSLGFLISSSLSIWTNLSALLSHL